jgi:hypothetical protein
MKLLFCYNPEMRKLPEPRFEQEYDAALECGFECYRFGFEDLLAGREERAFQFLPDGQQDVILYRGWIFRESEYRRFDAALHARGYRLFTPPDAYAEALYLPNHYRLISRWTVPAVWTQGTDLDTAWRSARSLGNGPWIVKDHVKSAKHKWESACFIPKDADRTTFDEICNGLIAYQADRFERGFVFKQFVPLARLGDSAFGYPLSEEYRLFYFRRRLLTATPYDRQGGPETDFTRYDEVAGRFQSEFLSVDIARTAAGAWLVLEVGDGGVSMIPPQLGPRKFYEALQRQWTGN